MGLRILVVTEGLEPLLERTVVGLVDRGHRVRVVGAFGPDELGAEERFRLGSRLRVEGGEPGGPTRAAARTVRRVVVAAGRAPRDVGVVASRTRATQGVGKRFRNRMAELAAVLAQPADVVYFEGAHVALRYAALLDRLAPRVVMCTGSDVRILPDLNPWMAGALPAVFGAASQVVCRSAELREWALRRGAPPGRTSVLLPAVDHAAFTPPSRPPRADAALRLVSVGRLHWVKGYEVAVEAVARARGAGVDCTYSIVGADRGAGDAVRYAIRDRDLGDCVTLVGPKPVPGVRAALARSDAFVLSSVSEGASRAAMEAMAMGLPVVTTDVGGMREVVDDGVHGVVVPARDPAALADAFGALAADPDRRRAMGARARERAEQFALGPQIDAVDEVLGRAAGNRVVAARAPA